MNDSKVKKILKDRGFSGKGAEKALKSFKKKDAEDPEDFIIEFGGEGKTHLLGWLKQKKSKKIKQGE